MIGVHMDKQAVIARIEEIAKAIENSLAQHNALVGRLNEAKYILEQMEKFEQDVKDRNISGVAGDVINVVEEIAS
jgi:bisphosphoglycerate-independent phosphoglycerate mutase (AlkP superfamily)